MNVSEFLDDDYEHYLNDKQAIVLVIISLVLAFAICTQKEEEYIQYFEAVGDMPEDSGDEIKLFLNILIQEVENRNMILDSQLKASSSRKIIFGFEDKINEYEDRIVDLTNKLSFANREVKRLKHSNERLEFENADMKHTIERLSVSLSDLTDRHKKELKNELELQEKAFQKRIKELTRQLGDAELENDRTMAKLEKVRQKKKALKEENLSQNKALSDISENYIDKEQHERNMRERLELQKRYLEMENNYALEVSETKSLKRTLSKQEKELLKYKRKDKEYKKKIDELRQKNSQMTHANTNSNNLIKSNFTTPNRGFSNNNGRYKAYGLDTNPLNDDYSHSDFDFDSRASPRKQPNFDHMNENIEKLKQKMEMFKEKKSSENREHEKIIKQLMEDIKILKKKGSGGESYYDRSRTSRFKSRDISGGGRGKGMSEDLIQKVMGMEKKIKELTSENKYLHQSIVKNLSSYKFQTDILYSTIKSYINN